MADGCGQPRLRPGSPGGLGLPRVSTDESPRDGITAGAPKGKKQQGKGGSFLTSEELESFAGSAKSTVCMVAPALLDHVREDVGKKGELMKSLAKAREFREAMRKGAKETEGE